MLPVIIQEGWMIDLRITGYEMKSYQSYVNDYPVYPGEYQSLPAVESELQNVSSNTREFPITPLVNMHEFKEYYKIEAVIPGVSREDIFVTVDNEILTVRVLHKQTHPCEYNLNLHEFEGKYFERHLVLPPNADSVFISASYKDGLLTIHLPKSQNPLRNFPAQIVTY